MSKASFLSSFSHIKFRVVGLNIENFLIELASAGARVGHVRRKGKSVTMVVSASNQSLVKNVAKKYDLEVIALKTTGLKALANRAKYMIGALFGIVFWAVLLFSMAQQILWVAFAIPQNHTCTNGTNCIFLEDNLAQVKQFLAENGVAVGQKYTANCKAMELRVLANFELVESCQIVKDGSKITINLTEATGKNLQTATAIVASQNCIIYSIVTFSGVARVKAGDVVKQGDVLVEADGNIAPRAEILLQVYHTGMAIYNSNQQIMERTGKTQTICELSIFGKTFLQSSPQFSLYETEQQTSFVAPNLFLPLKAIKITIYEMEIKEKFVPFEDVRAQILAVAKQNAIQSTTGTILECNYSIVTEGNITRVDCYITSVEPLE